MMLCVLCGDLLAADAALPKDRYVVRRGDGLMLISLRLYGTHRYWRELAHANSLNAPYRILIGRTLSLPMPPRLSEEEGAERVAAFWGKRHHPRGVAATPTPAPISAPTSAQTPTPMSPSAATPAAQDHQYHFPKISPEIQPAETPKKWGEVESPSENPHPIETGPDGHKYMVMREVTVSRPGIYAHGGGNAEISPPIQEEKYRALFDEGKKSFDSGDFKSAIELFSESHTDHEDFVPAWFYELRALDATGQKERRREVKDEFLRRFPQFSVLPMFSLHGDNR